MAVRRQVKCNKQSISLVRLLQHISEHEIQIEREEFIELNSNRAFGAALYQQHRREASRMFDFFAGRGKQYLSKERVLGHVSKLKRSAKKLEYYSDKWVAHSDQKRRWPRLRFDELNKTLDLYIDIWRRYHNIAWGGPIGMDAEFLAGTTWEEVLTIPWKTTSSRKK